MEEEQPLKQETPIQRDKAEDLVIKCINESRELLAQAQSRIGPLINNSKVDAAQLKLISDAYEVLRSRYDDLNNNYFLNKQASKKQT